MAALVEGQQYGLSAQDKINSNKSLIFVKLTDSALRSIEEYVKFKGDTLTKPTIQFLNNNGIISLPSHGSSRKYGFTLSNVEADGPQGSFECLQQTSHMSLESLGCMLMKMHIHANEDSYEKTRVKMAAAEQEHKKFCTKEIKPNGPHLGRKVKVKRPGLIVSPAKVSPPSPPTPPKNTFKPLNLLPIKKQEQPKFNKQNSKSNCPELLRQPIRDRIIHILAVRPYKRPELIVKLINEGIREKDRKGITAILTQVATLKGNIYTLANYLWNEVQENWKFCSQEDLEIIRKKKQLFLNANSDSEVLSPNSQPSCSPTQKRVSETVTNDQEPRSKKLRISHFVRPENINHSLKNDSSDYSASDKNQLFGASSCQRSPYSPGQVIGFRNGYGESSQKSPLSLSYDSGSNHRSSPTNHGEDSLLLSSSLTQRSNNSSTESSEKNISFGLSQVSSVFTNHDKFSHKEPIVNNDKIETEKSDHRHLKNGYKGNHANDEFYNKLQKKVVSHPKYNNSKQVSPDSNFHVQESRNESSKTVTNGYVNGDSIKSSYNGHTSFLNGRSSIVTSTTNGSCSNSPHSSSDSRDSMEYNNSSDLQVSPPSESLSEYDGPDYIKEYVTIKSLTQRAQYKADFNAEYEEYLRLHALIQSVSQKFAALEERLRTFDTGSEEYNRIKAKIVKEHRKYQRDPMYNSTLKKFNFLHCKLSHIKRLVMEYDNARCLKS